MKMYVHIRFSSHLANNRYYISTSNVLKVSDFNQEMLYCFVYNAMKLFNKQNKSIYLE